MCELLFEKQLIYYRHIFLTCKKIRDSEVKTIDIFIPGSSETNALS